MKKIAIVTPLKNEIRNIDRLIESVVQQSIPVFAWIIVENDSDDGSKEKLAAIKNLPNVTHFEVITMQFEDKTYKLGRKYSSIVNHGFEYLKNQRYYNEVEFIGILDSDCFPEEKYYAALTSFMENDPDLGISSGLTLLEDGSRDIIRNENWVRGNCRLWKKKCFEQAGYIIGPSADTLSVGKAIAKGWKIYTNKTIFVTTRDWGNRVNFSYYGSSAYFRGHTPLYAFLFSVGLFLKGKRKGSGQFFSGYMSSYRRKAERTDDNEILGFYRNYMMYKFMARIRR